MRRFSLLTGIILATALACGGLEDAPTVELTDATGERIPFSESDDPVEAYLQSCSAVRMVYDDMEDREVSDCEWLEFDQMCAPDPSGCWDKGQECKAGCATTCTTCSSSFVPCLPVLG